MAYARRTKSQLLEEYGHLKFAIPNTIDQLKPPWGPPNRSHVRETATDISWLTGTTGKPMEVARLLRTAEAARMESPKAKDLLERVQAYARWSNMPRSKSPRPKDWVRLVGYVRRQLKGVKQDIELRKQSGRDHDRLLRRRLAEMERRFIELEWLLRDTLPEDREDPWWHPRYGRTAV